MKLKTGLSRPISKTGHTFSPAIKKPCNAINATRFF
jgi:hypothetical protein